MRYQTQFKGISSGASLSEVFELQGVTRIGLTGTIPTSCVAYLQVSYDTSSANFGRAYKTDGSGVWAFNVGSIGVFGIDLKDVGVAFPYARIETGVAQAGVGSLCMVFKLYS